VDPTAQPALGRIEDLVAMLAFNLVLLLAAPSAARDRLELFVGQLVSFIFRQRHDVFGGRTRFRHLLLLWGQILELHSAPPCSDLRAYP